MMITMEMSVNHLIEQNLCLVDFIFSTCNTLFMPSFLEWEKKHLSSLSPKNLRYDYFCNAQILCVCVSVVNGHQIAITCSFQDLQIPMQVSGFPDTPSLPRSTTPPLSLYRIHFHSRVSRYLLRSCLVSDQSLPFHTLTVLQCYNKGKGGRSITGHFHCFSPVLVQNRWNVMHQEQSVSASSISE